MAVVMGSCTRLTLLQLSSPLARARRPRYQPPLYGALFHLLAWTLNSSLYAQTLCRLYIDYHNHLLVLSPGSFLSV